LLSVADDKKALNNGSYLPLQSFFLALKQNGFLVTPQQMVDANRIINEFANDLRNEEELCLYLSPLFARNEEEQQQFEEIFTAHFKPQPISGSIASSPLLKPKTHWQKHWWKYAGAVLLLVVIYFLSRPDAPPAPELPPVSLSDKGDYLRRKDGQQPFQVVVGEVLEVSTAWPVADVAFDSTFSLRTRYFWGDSKALTADSSHAWQQPGLYTVTAYADLLQNGVVMRQDTLTETAKVCPTLSKLTILNPAGDSIETGRKIRFESQLAGPPPDSILWLVNDERSGYGKMFETSFDQPGFATVTCVAIYDSLHSPCTVINYLNLNVFDPYDFAIALSAAPDAKPVQLTYKVKPVIFYLAGALMIVLFVAFIKLALKWNKQKKKEKEAEEIDQQFVDWLRTFSGKKRPAPMPFRDKAYLSVPEPELKTAAMQMRRRISSNAVLLDIPKTIDTAIRRNGFFEPVYTSRLQESEYLVLIDSSHNNNQQVKLFDFLIDTLRKQNIHIEKWYYRYEPSQCFNNIETQGVSLEKLSERFPNHTLLIFGNAYQLLQPFYPVINPDYLQLLYRWQYKAVLTPVSFPDWSTKEWDALLPNLPVVPVDVEGQLLLMDSLFAANYDLPSALKQQRNRFYSIAPIDFEDVEALEVYCHDAMWARVGHDKSANILFQWIAALAVYPRINWEITLSVGKAILDRYGKPAELNFSNLLRLARIKWMKDGQFPDYTRLDLLKKLLPANEVTARETILAMLNEIPEAELGASHMAYEEKEVQRVTNEFLLYAHDPEKYSLFGRSKIYFEKLWKRNKVRDAAAQVYLKNEKKEWSTLVGAKDERSQSLDDYFEPDKEKDDRSTRRLRRLMLTASALFWLSVLAMAALLVIHLSGINSFPALTYRPPKNVQISFVADNKTPVDANRFAVGIDFLRYNLDSATATSFPLLLSDSSKTVSVFFENSNIYQTAMPLTVDKYRVMISRNTAKPIVNIMLPGSCAAMAGKFRQIVKQSAGGMVVKDSLFPNVATTSNVCLNQIVFGANIKSQDVERIMSAFKMVNVNLSIASVSVYPVGANEIRLFYRQEPQRPKSLIYIQYNDRSKLGEVQRLQRTLVGAGFAAPGVEFRSLSKAFSRDEIRYLNATFKDSIALLQAVLKKIYPNRTFAVSQTNARGSIASAEIWIYESDTTTVPPSNLYGISEQAFVATATFLACEVAALKATVEVEGAGRGMLDKGKPRILFEPHIFWRQLKAKGIDPTGYAEKNPDLLSPTWKPGNYGPISSQYDKLGRASAIDEEAALMSASWGTFQIMGQLYLQCGFSTVQEFAAAMAKGPDEQMIAFGRYLLSADYADELRQRDWKAFARQYNGPAYTKNKYDEKLQNAYLKYAKTGSNQMMQQSEQIRNQAPNKVRMKGSKG
jgi:hypothetical protein